MDIWATAKKTFLDSRLSPATRRAYAFALECLEAASGKGLGEIQKADVVVWASSMRRDGLAESTVQQRLAGTRSFYDFSAEMYDLDQPNPARARSLRGARITPYGKAVWLSPDQASALLMAIDRSTVRGKRDYALIMGYLLLGKRNSEWRSVRVKDLGAHGVHWSGKGRKEGNVAYPEPLRAAIEEYLRADGRTVGKPNEFVFRGRGSGALSAEAVRDVLRKHLHAAALDGQGIHVHSLRHTAAMLRKLSGEDISEIRNFLGHSNVATTQVYVQALGEREGAGWVKVAEMLGLEVKDGR